MTTLHFDYFFSRNENLAKLILHASTVDTLLKRSLHALFQPRITEKITHSIDLSLSQTKMAMISTKAKTTKVVCVASFRVGHTTLRTSLYESLGKAMNPFPGAEKMPPATPGIKPTASAAPRTYPSWPRSQKKPTNPAKTN